MNELWEEYDCLIQFGFGDTIYMTVYKLGGDQVRNFNRYVGQANNVENFIGLAKAYCGISFMYGEFNIIRHRLILTSINNVLCLIGFPKSAPRFDDTTKEKIKYLIWEQCEKKTEDKKILDILGLSNYSLPSSNNQRVILPPPPDNYMSSEEEKLMQKYYPDFNMYTIALWHQILLYECDRYGIDIRSLFEITSSRHLLWDLDNGEIVDSDNGQISEEILSEIRGEIPPVSSFINALHFFLYDNLQLFLILKIVPNEWDIDNILKHVKIDQEKYSHEIDWCLVNEGGDIALKFNEITYPLKFPTWLFLDAIIPHYQKIIESNVNNISEKYEEIRYDIEDWLKSNFNGYTAKNPKGFIKWILNNKTYPPFHIVYDYYFNPSSKLWGNFHLMLPDWKIEDFEYDLIRYCEERSRELGSKKPLVEKTYDNSIYESLISICLKLPAKILYWEADENSRNTYIRDLLARTHRVNDQSLQGEASGQETKNSGELDLIVYSNDSQNPVTICEGLNLDHINKSELIKHLVKLEKGYDKWGLREKYLLIYADVSESFLDFSNRYKDFLQNHSFVYHRQGEIEPLQTEYTDLNVYKTTHIREGKTVYLYHMLIKMPRRRKSE
ncbi:hypothetical protein [Runella zeae]|uniref:hypothetical protein n=1 Tax=Runella zeae TaxID=94255 RepID=UPI002355694E|nr:hypothetical protein [Runella zeae]